jgi:predicted transposase/invertase (TIGR01784 family)
MELFVRMKRDSLFYRLFSQSPELLFELLEDRPHNAFQYRFDSVAVKEPKFEIDGVFLPPESEGPGIVYFCEVQMQKDDQLYERLFGESMLYFYRQRARFSDWQAVVIYPSRSVEQKEIYPYRALLNSDQVHRVYLNELGPIERLPLGVATMVLTIAKESEAGEQARMLLGRANQEIDTVAGRRGIIEMVSRIMVYKFTRLSSQEIDDMLGIKVEETRVYQEAQEKKAQAIALNMLHKQLDLETIAEVTGLTIAQLQQLQAANQ